jgi:hypothetical protein
LLATTAKHYPSAMAVCGDADYRSTSVYFVAAHLNLVLNVFEKLGHAFADLPKR